MTWCDTKAGTPKTRRMPPENRCRVSDWYLWRIHLKFRKQNESESTWNKDFNADADTQDTVPVWRNDGSFIATDNEGF